MMEPMSDIPPPNDPDDKGYSPEEFDWDSVDEGGITVTPTTDLSIVFH